MKRLYEEELLEPVFLIRSRASVFGALLTLAFALRLFLFVGYANVDPWDDTLYLELAQQTRDGNLGKELQRSVAMLDWGQVHTSLTFILRRGAYLPIAACQVLLGPTELSSALPSLLASLATMLLTYRIGCLLASRSTGLWAAVLFAFIPLDLVLSTRILSDALQLLWVTASIAATLEAVRGGWWRRRRLVLYGLAGLSMYFAYFTKVTGLIGLPLVLAAAWPAFRSERTRIEPLAFLGTFTVLLVLDCTLFFVVTGHFLLVFELELAAARALLAQNPEVLLRPFSGVTVHCSYLEGVPHHFFKLLLGITEHYGGLKLFSMYAPMGAAALVYALARRTLSLPILWLVSVFVYIQYGFRYIEWDPVDGVLHYFLNAHSPRYLEMLVPALCLLLGSLLADVLRWSRFVALASFILLVAPSLYHARENHRFYRGSMEDVRRAAEFLLEREAAPVYADDWCRKQIQLLSRGLLSEPRPISEGMTLPAGAWIVTGGSRGFDIPSHVVRSTLPAAFAALHVDPARAPENWELVLRLAGPRDLSRVSDLTIFRVRPN